MTDEQRGQTRPDGDVAQHATGAGEPSSEQGSSSPDEAARPAGVSADAPTAVHAHHGASHSPYASAPQGSVYGTPGYAQSRSGPYSSYGTPGYGYGTPAYGPYASVNGAAGGSSGPADPPGGGHTAVLEGDRPRRQSGVTGKVVAAALIAGLVGGGAGFGGAYALLGSSTPSAAGGTTLSGTPASAASNTPVNGTVAAAASKAMPSTVDIRVQSGQGVAEGSGVVLTADGDILTNNHVVAGSTGKIEVTFADGSTHPATVVGTSPSYDLAVIRADGVSGLTAATLGRSTDVKVGQQVVAIGSPQGLSGTVTAGIVSALNRTVSVEGDNGAAVVYNGLQTDAPINQGNSGGPLVNLDGQVIGINSAIATAGNNTGSIGLGFAIPVDQARRVAQEIINTGKATKPVLGVTGSTGRSTSGGATIAQVVPGGPADAAGLKPGDVVTKVGEATVSDFSDLVARIGAYAPGDKVTLTIGSGNPARTVQVTLGSTTDTGATTSSGGSSSGGSGSGGSNSPFGGFNPFGQGGR